MNLFQKVLISTYCILIPLIAVKSNSFQFQSSTYKDTLVVIKNDTIEIMFPSGEVRGQIMVLPGWNFSRKTNCNESSFCTKALNKGYILILPEMRKSIYASRTYPETRKDWLKYPTLTWVIDTLIPMFQLKLQLLQPNGNNYLFGISTGGRGVALIAEATKKIFKAGAALSGDYDQTLQPSDNLMRMYYGNYTDFPERWTGSDNPLHNCNKINIPLYLGHGLEDNVVPSNQTLQFYNALKASSKLPHQLNLMKKKGHNYQYWDAETDAVLNFFSMHQQRY